VLLTHDVHALRETSQSKIIMLPHQDIQPSHESQHIGIIVHLRQTILGMTLYFVPDVPLVESDLERLGG